MPSTTTPPKIYTAGIPRKADMADYLARILAIWSAMPALPGTPTPPQSMDDLTYSGANDIERILLQADRAADSIEKSWIYSGELESGGI